MKRKLADTNGINGASSPSKRQNISSSRDNVELSFAAKLFLPETIASYRNAYDTSSPYPHAIVPSLIEESLLRRVRNEITSSISFTLKETDIYRIHQSGDLANLSNLDTASLAHLPSLVRLRDALYSSEFREWVSEVTGAGKLSGVKTDMAVNVYMPGSYLLCHDDVIGSRRVSYILYLTDPDDPWQAKWGGGLRLHATEPQTNKAGEEIRVPLPEHALNIPPAFSQLSFFAVRPGESYHDVEEVYHGEDLRENKRRVRMAISGWFHIPQEGETGYEKGAEEAQAQKSSLAQLKGAADEFDKPQVEFKQFDEARMVATSDGKSNEVDPGEDGDTDDEILTEQDLTFLLNYISPSFLTPDMTEQLAESFGENSFIQLERFLSEKFAQKIKAFIQSEEARSPNEVGGQDEWEIARPPHKHRYLYLRDPASQEVLQTKTPTPISQLLVDFLRSHVFKKWLALITGLAAPSLVRQNAFARRFRRGKDYALASGYHGKQPQIEFTVSLTPTVGWETADDDGNRKADESHGKQNRHSKVANGGVKVEASENVEFGGEEAYMAGDDDDHESLSLPQVGKKADPAVYKSANDEDEDGILFMSSAAWNQLSVVLRDRGTLRFVKYISAAATGDRWDVKGEIELSAEAFAGEEGEDVQDEEENDGQGSGLEDEEDDEELLEDEDGE